MRKLLSVLMVAAVCCGCLSSCNVKPKSYRFVMKAKDGSEKVEDIKAKNDTDALNQYLDRMSQVIVESLEKKEPAFESMYVISPDGDTLNTDKELLEAVSNNFKSDKPDTIMLGTIPAGK